MPVEKSPAVRALGEAIRSARRERGYGQEGFAAHVGLDRSYFGAIERGEFNVTVDTTMTIAKGLKVPAAELFKRAKL